MTTKHMLIWRLWDEGALDREAVRVMRALGFPRDCPGAACRDEEIPLVLDDEGNPEPAVRPPRA